MTGFTTCAFYCLVKNGKKSVKRHRWYANKQRDYSMFSVQMGKLNCPEWLEMWLDFS